MQPASLQPLPLHVHLLALLLPVELLVPPLTSSTHIIVLHLIGLVFNASLGVFHVMIC